MSSSLSRRQVRRRILLWLGVSGVAVAIAVWSALDRHVGESRSQVAAPLRGVVYRGCAYVIREGACVLATDRVLTLFLPDTQSSRLQVRADGGLVTTTHTDLRDGIRISLRVPEDAKSVSLETDTGRFALRIAELPRQAALETLLALRSQGKLEELRARALALGTEAGSALDALALGVVARTWRDQGDVERTVRELRASQAAADRAGVASAALWDGLALAHILRVDLWRFDEARQALARLARWLPECPHLRGEVAFARAIWERDTGNLRGALGPLRDAETHARRLGQTWMMINAGQARARILHTLGRDDEARELFDALAATLDGDPCNELLYAHNRGWVELLQVDSTGGPVPRVLLDRAVDLSAPGGSCPSADFYLAARVNRVQATVASGRLEDAETQIRLLREGDATLDADVRAALLELRGRISLERGHAADALEAYSELRARAQASSLPTFSWRAELGRGRALQSQGDLDAASQAYQAAERELDADQQRIPLGEGRETFAGAREASAKRLVDVLERLGEPGRALRAARLARTRALRTLAAFDRVASLDGEARAKWTRGLANYQRLRNDLALHAARAWEVPKSELSGYEETTRERRFALQAALDETLALLDVPAPVLSGPAPGEVFLLYFPTPTGWLGFAQGQKTESHRFDQLPADREGLIRPFERQLLKARQVGVFSYGAVREIDVHALGVRGRPLIAQVPVVYSLDLGRAPLDDSPRRRALVVADPAQDLSAARREGRDSARWLARFFPTSILEARAATRDAVIRGFTPDLSVWHFAGHGELEGRGGWLSALWLTEGQKLEVSDILTLPQVPVHVVLSGCETAREAGDSPVAAIGIAQAFVIRGASAVFATNRQVSDESGRAFSAALYAEGERPVFDARHFQRAILRVSAAGHGDWSAYRMLVP